MDREDYFFVVRFSSFGDPDEPPPGPLEGKTALARLKDLTSDEAEAVRQAVILENEEFQYASGSWMESESEVRKNPGRYLVLCRQSREIEDAMAGTPEYTLLQYRYYRPALGAYEHAKEVRKLRENRADQGEGGKGSVRSEGEKATSQRFEVFDEAAKQMLVFDTEGTQSWYAHEDEEWDPVDLFFHYSVELTLYQHHTGHWTLLVEKSHYEFGSLGPPDARRLDDAEAADWLVRHGHEVPSDMAHLAKHSFFVPSQPTPPQPEAVERIAPLWNKDRCELTYRDTIIKRVKSLSVAKNVVRVLDAFKEDGWPDRIDDPLDPSKDQQRLHETIKRLNDNLQMIRFRSDGTGQGIRWELTAPEPPQEPPDTPF
jgi:hypothetical protein